MLLIISIIHIVIIGLADALIKGNIIASHNNNWSAVPWYFKDENLIYPALIFFVFGLLAGLFVKRKTSWGWTYLAMLVLWALSGLESLSYWFWIAVLKINQTMWWFSDDSFFWWYPKEAPWLNKLIHLKWLSLAENVTREGVFYGIAIAFAINIIIYVFKESGDQTQVI